MQPRVSLRVVFALSLALLPLLPLTTGASDEQQWVVSSTADGGLSTLREALLLAPRGATITFDPSVFPPDEPASILLRSPLPPLAQGELTLDASAAGVIISGRALEGGSGLHIISVGNIVRGLQILRFPAHGILLERGAYDNLIGGQNTAAGHGCSTDCNVISGNGGCGVEIRGPDAGNNHIAGNLIGTDATGTSPLGNSDRGVNIAGGAKENLVGGVGASERNVISGNRSGGVTLSGPGVAQNLVIGNYVGTDVSGSVSLPNGRHGVCLGDGAQYNRIGGTTAGEGNLISGNAENGVTLESPGTTYNVVLANRIGTDATGTLALPNEHGVYLRYGASENQIGREEGNLISGNRQHGVAIEHQATANVISHNRIGTALNGIDPLPNGLDGVWVAQGAQANTIGPGNEIAFNRRDGVGVEGSSTLGNRVTSNSVFFNFGLGIHNVDSGNLELPAPEIDAVVSRLLRGRAPPEARVEVFSTLSDEGCFLEGSTIADGRGNFVLEPAGGRFQGPYVTAIALDWAGNTSEFSRPAAVPAPRVMRELPGIVSPLQVSVEPKVVGTNLALALFCVLFFGFTSNVFNEILKGYRDELVGMISRWIPWRLPRTAALPDKPPGGGQVPGWLTLLVPWWLALGVTAVLESLLDAQVPLWGRERLGLVATLFLAGVVVSGLKLAADLFARRRLAPTVKLQSKVQWLGIPIALACVLLSRALDFQPGYLFGVVGTVYLMPDLENVAKAGRRALIVLLSLFIGGLVLWLATPLLPASLAELEPLFLTVFLLTLQGVFFALLPLTVTDGGELWSWRKGQWLAFYVVVLFLFHHVVLNPDASDVQALRQNGVQTLWVLIGTYGLATLLLWLWFPFRLRRRPAGAV
jgi:hypothetical protein